MRPAKVGSQGAQAGVVAAEAAALAEAALEPLTDLRDAIVRIARLETTDEDIVRGPESTNLPDIIVSLTGSMVTEANRQLRDLNDAVDVVSILALRLAHYAKTARGQA